MLDGSVPDRELLLKSIDCNAVNSPISDGSEPVRFRPRSESDVTTPSKLQPTPSQPHTELIGSPLAEQFHVGSMIDSCVAKAIWHRASPDD